MDLLRWLNGTNSGGSAAFVPGVAQHDLLWPGVTTVLSLCVATGYCAVAINWFFQSRLSHYAESKDAIARLRNISIVCAICGLILYSAQTPWVIWRLYDAFLLLIAFHAWSFVARTRGLGLVDDRLKQVDELERSATKYREIAELLPHMVWTATDDGRVDFSNQRWREYVGDDRTWVEALHPDEWERVWSQWNAAIASRQPVTIEARLRKGGESAPYRTFVIKATPIVRGDAVKWLGACADVEDQKQLAAEKEMQARQKSFFLNALSHDIRAPLHNVLLNAHLLKTSVSDEADAESVEMIVENAVAAGDLVTKLLDFAKVGAQDLNDIERVSIAAVLQQVVRRFQPITEHKGLYLRVADAETDAHVLTDRQKLERIVSNLVDNAIKYTERGGVILDLRVREGAVCVQVLDSGVGVAPEHVPHLFDEFYQVNNYERDRSKGFGMGLAICRSLARHIGGDVRLAHTGPDGSCFEVAIVDTSPTATPVSGGRIADGVDRGGRPLGAHGHHEAAEASGLCRV
ncbi:MAG: PAS domain-containing sensor histidine kinase [Planctomycetota bacterium]|nr:PAS domain-containing sensor histidine kinase [Planctomycetota bacterium]